MANTVGPRAPVAANTPADQADTGEELISVEEQRTIAKSGEDLQPGEVVFIDLDDQGRPTGTATLDPDPSKPQAPAVLLAPPTPDEVTTPSGAPLTTQMNPAPTALDEGFYQRNPKPPVIEKERTTKTTEIKRTPVTATAKTEPARP